MSNALSVAECIIYAILALPVLYLLARHWRNGVLGWLFLFFFCTLRIVGGALSIKSSSSAASIISSVGLSPLLLAAAGILHESRIYRIYPLNKKIEQIQMLVYHMAVVAGVALTAAGSVKLEKHEEPIEKAERMVKVGMAILTIAWGILVGFAGLSWFGPVARESGHMRAGTVLLTSVCSSLVFIGIRVFYSLAYLTTRKGYLNPVTGSLAIRVVLSFLPELIAALIYIVAGIMTQGAGSLSHEKPKQDFRRQRSHLTQPYV